MSERMTTHTSPQDDCPACPPRTGAGDPPNPCPDCGNHVNPHILAVDPDCPHGWEVARPGDLAELYAEAWEGA